MVALRSLLLLLVAALAQAAPTPPSQVERAAFNSLKGCQFTTAVPWAASLDQSAPDLAALYRLAWIQQLRARAQTQAQAAGDGQVAWRFSGEMWRDELPALDGTVVCLEQAPQIHFSEIPENAAEEILRPLLSRLKQLRPEVRAVLANWLIYRWENDQSETWDASQLSGDLEWMALAHLHQGTEATLPLSVPQKSSKILAAWALELGDEALEAGNNEQAVVRYEQAMKLTPDAPSSALWHRLALARLATADRETATLRAALAALDPTDSETTAATRTALANQTCEWLGQFDRRGVEWAMRRAAGDKKWRSRAKALVQKCSVPETESLASALVAKAATPREKAELTARLMGFAERGGHSGRAQTYAGRLAVLSRDERSLAAHYFWKEGISPRSAASSTYRMRARWGLADEARRKRALAEEDPRQAVESIRAKRPLLLPEGEALPNLKASDPAYDFVSLFAHASGVGQ